MTNPIFMEDECGFLSKESGDRMELEIESEKQANSLYRSTQ